MVVAVVHIAEEVVVENNMDYIPVMVHIVAAVVVAEHIEAL